MKEISGKSYLLDLLFKDYLIQNGVKEDHPSRKRRFLYTNRFTSIVTQQDL